MSIWSFGERWLCKCSVIVVKVTVSDRKRSKYARYAPKYARKRPGCGRDGQQHMTDVGLHEAECKRNTEQVNLRNPDVFKCSVRVYTT